MIKNDSHVKYKFTDNNRFNIYLKIYLTSLFFFALIFLFDKRNVGIDSTINEWIINYQGGFTRRGLTGELFFYLSKYFNIGLRLIIFTFQIIIYFIFINLIFKYLKNIRINLLLIFAIFTPIFLLYPVAEVEVLARKETLLFIGFLYFLILHEKDNNYSIIFASIFCPIMLFIWEPSIFFYGYFVSAVLVKEKNFNQNLLLKILLICIPIAVIFVFIITNLLPQNNWLIMKSSLLQNFNEQCLGACSLLGTKISIYEQFRMTIGEINIEAIFRYFLIFLIGFMPLLLLIKYSKSTHGVKIYSYISKIYIIFFLNFIPVIVLFLSASDWGRWINISYTFALLFYLYLYKNNFINLNIPSGFNKYFNNNKKLLYFLFFIFAFMWNPKTAITGDIATNPIYKIPYNSIKIVFEIDSIRLFEDNPIIKFHKKYIE